jgi:hypothetical protein
MNGVVEMLIGYTNEMSDHDLADLADWADYHAKEVPNPTWKRAYALIREGSDLLLRRRAGCKQDEECEKEIKPTKARSHSYDHE